MKARTKNLFFASLAVAVIAISGTSYFFYKIKNQSDTLQEQVRIVADNRSKEEEYVRLKKLADDTADERALLASAFFKNEGDSINFLGEIEALAKVAGLDLKTEALDKIETKDGKESIKISFSYSGKKQTVFDFSKLLETIPLHSQMESLTLAKSSGADWLGKATFSITIDSI